MAHLIPENLASRRGVPARVRSVAAVLRDQLPDDATVWLEHSDSRDQFALELAGGDFGSVRSEAYLAVALPWHGLLLADVLKGGQRALAKHELPGIDPDLVSRAIERLSEANRPVLERLDERGIPAVPVCVAPHVDSEAADFGGRPAPPVLFSDDLSRLETAIADLFERHGFADGVLSNPGPVTHKAIQAALHPEFIIKDDREPPEQGRLVLRQIFEPDDSQTIKVLDRSQEQRARWMGNGYQVVKGVAGSGKTLILLSRARLMAEAQPRWRVLLTCFNRVLADELSRHLQDLRNVTVKNIDRLPYDLRDEVRHRGDELELPDGSDYDGRIAVCLDYLPANEESALFDAVLVDESQDFDEPRLELAWRLLKPGRSHFVVARDEAQNVYRRPPWIPPDTSGRGRTSILDQNYRNTEEILRTALALLDGGDGQDRTGDPETADVIIPPRSALRHGRPPELIHTTSSGEVRVACDRIEGLITDGVSCNDIAVLCGNRHLQARYAAQLSRRGVPNIDLSSSENRRTVGRDVVDRVLVASLRLLKGLEFPYVFLSGLSEIALGDEAHDDTTARRTLYVAMTRATTHLIVMASGDESYSSDIQKAIDRLRR